MALRYVTASIAILLSSSFAVQAKSIKFEEVLTITVPGLDTIRKCDFGNVYYFQDCPEVLASDGVRVALYSHSRDSVLYSLPLDTNSLYPYHIESHYDIALSDLDKDAIADIAVGIYDMYFPVVHIFYYSGSGFYGIIDSGTVAFAASPLCEYPFGIMSFDAIDVNADGYDELIFSCDSSRGMSAPSCWAELGAITRAYLSFPDSLLWKSSVPLSDPVLLRDSQGCYFAATRHAAGFHEAAGYAAYNDKGIVEFINNSGANTRGQDTEGCIQSKLPISAGRGEYVDVSSIGCVGDIDLSTQGQEILVCRDHRQSYFSYPDTAIYQSDPQLTLIRFIPPRTMDTIWSIAPSALLANCVYLPDHPGYFFAFDGQPFVQYRGTDGSEFQSTADVPVGNKKWMYPFNDGQPYLVTLHSNTITIYRPMVITDVGEEADQQLPITLSLGPPHPNPFNASQTIPVKIRAGQPFTVDVYDLLGRRVDRIYLGIPFINDLELHWNAGALPSGVYFIKATAGNQVAVKKSILLK